MRFLLTLLVLAYCVSAFPADSDQGWEVSLSLASDRAEYVLHEPVPLRISWKNVTNDEKYIRPDKPQLVISRDGTQRLVNLYETSVEKRVKEMDESKDRSYRQFMVKPNESHEDCVWMLLGGPVGAEADFLFDGAGEWGVGWPRAYKGVVKFRVAAPREADKKAAALFSKEAAAVFLGEPGPDSAIKDLASIVVDYPGSIYAPYAVVALAGREQKSGTPELDKEKMDAGFESVMRTHPNDLLGEIALDLAISRAVEVGDYATAVPLYKRLKATFPKSRFVESSRALDGAAMVRVDLKKPEENKPVKENPPSTGIPDGRSSVEDPGAKPAKVTGQAQLEFPDSEKLPAQVNELLHKYWRARIAEDVGQIKLLTGDDYLHNGQDWTQWQDKVQKAWAAANQRSVVVQIQSCEEKTSFEAGSDLPNQRKHVYRGPLYVVVAEITTREQDLSTEREMSQRICQTSAVAQVKDRWLILGEESRPRSEVLQTQVTHLWGEMGYGLSRPTVNTKDGKMSVSTVLQRTLKMPETTPIKWVGGALEMIGELKDIPVLRGVVSTLTADGREIKTPVSLRFTMKDNALFLEEVVLAGSVTPGEEKK